MTYHDFFMYTNLYWDFSRGFEIVQEFVDSVIDEITAFNFNRYGIEGSKRPDRQFHITVRLDIKTEDSLEEIEHKLEEMKSRGVIQDWRPEANTHDIEPMRDYHPVYHTAHETSTACAFRFWSELKKDANELQEFMQNKIQYLGPVFAQLLKYSGFSMLQNLTLNINSFKDNLAKMCADSFSEVVDKNKIGDDSALFTSRFIHLFFNCICFSQEPHLVRLLMQRVNFKTEYHGPMNEKFPFYIALGQSFS